MLRHTGRLCVALLLTLILPGCVGLEFSPDGKQLIVTWRTEADKTGLLLVNADGSGTAALPNTQDGYLPAWSPNGRYVLFAVSEEGRPSLHIYETADKSVRKLAGNFRPPVAWREDSRAFAAIRESEEGKQEIVWYDMSEGGVRHTTELPFPTIGGLRMIWLPRTDEIAMLGGQDENALNVYLTEGGEVRRVTSTNDVIGLGLYPGGNRLIWARRSPNPKAVLVTFYTYAVSRRAVRRLDFPTRIRAINPTNRLGPESVDYIAFSPDNGHLALIATFDAGPDPSTRQPRKSIACFAMTMRGTEVRQVYRTPPLSDATRFILPAWSRDGKQLALLIAEGSAASLRLYNANGTGEKVLLTERAK